MNLSFTQLLIVLLPLLFLACTYSTTITDENKVESIVIHKDSIAESIVERAILTHGCNHLMNKTLTFEFRDIQYTAFKTNGKYIYTRSWKHDTIGYVQDSLVNSNTFSRWINNVKQNINKEEANKYGNSINSVLYFTLLPAGLTDAAVFKKYLGVETIKDSNYHKLKVTFNEKGGGDDHDDVYVYWINKESFTIDYLAYKFSVNGGGTRFRVATNRRTIEDVIFQDYSNYKSNNESESIENHGVLFETGSLKLLSEIVNKKIILN